MLALQGQVFWILISLAFNADLFLSAKVGFLQLLKLQMGTHKVEYVTGKSKYISVRLSLQAKSSKPIKLEEIEKTTDICVSNPYFLKQETANNLRSILENTVRVLLKIKHRCHRGYLLHTSLMIYF